MASEYAKVTFGIPQGSVLGPTLFTLYTNDLPDAITSGSTYADDTTIYCIEDCVYKVTTMLNNALDELTQWFKQNSLIPHPKKCETMIVQWKDFTGPHRHLVNIQ